MYFKAILQTLLDIMGISKEISRELRKKLWTSTSLVHPWEQFPNAWRYHVHLYKQWYASINTMGPHSRHTAQGGDAFCLLEMNVLWCEKCSKTAIKKPDYGLQLHMGTKIIHFGEMPSGLMKQKYNCLAIMTIIMFRGKMGMLARWRTPSQPWSTAVAASCCGGALLQEGLMHFTK